MVGTVVKKKQRMAVMQGCDSRVTRLFFFFFRATRNMHF